MQFTKIQVGATSVIAGAIFLVGATLGIEARYFKTEDAKVAFTNVSNTITTTVAQKETQIAEAIKNIQVEQTNYQLKDARREVRSLKKVEKRRPLNEQEAIDLDYYQEQVEGLQDRRSDLKK